MLPKGIMFDLDDTITTYSFVAESVWRKVCTDYSKKFDVLDKDRLYKTIIETRKWYWSDKERNKAGRKNVAKTRREIVNIVFEKLKIDNTPLAHTIADSFSKRRVEAIDFFQGAEEALVYFKKRGISLALVTNGQSFEQRYKIDKFRLERFFDPILIEEEVGSGKPEKIIFYRALKDLNLNPEDVWFVGDNLEWDVRGPQSVGIFSIWHNYQAKKLPENSKIIPDRIINRISELIER